MSLAPRIHAFATRTTSIVWWQFCWSSACGGRCNALDRNTWRRLLLRRVARHMVEDLKDTKVKEHLVLGGLPSMRPLVELIDCFGLVDDGFAGGLMPTGWLCGWVSIHSVDPKKRIALPRQPSFFQTQDHRSFTPCLFSSSILWPSQ